MSLLTPEVVDEKLLALHGWRRDGPMIVRDFEFADFAAAMGFVNKVAALAEQANHHPDIDIRYNRVRLSLISHDAGGLTQRDLKMAAAIQGIEVA